MLEREFFDMGLFRWLSRRKKRLASLSWERTSPANKPNISFDEEGRRHRADAPYLLPKDEKEAQRLHYQHFIFRQVLKGNTFAPVHHVLTQPSYVLDVGCGTGRWGAEIASTYPQAQVIGFDLEAVPRTPSMPLNYQFRQGNLFHGLPFPDGMFQYVHQRLLVAAIPLDRWSWVIGELRRVTAGGGWVELVEMGNTFHQAGPATKRFLEWWVAIAASRGIDASHMSELGLWLKRAGFSSIQVRTTLLPVGSWGGRLGNLLAQDMLAGWPSMRPLAHSFLGVRPEAFDDVMGRLEAEWNASHTTYEVYMACGQR